MISQTKLKERIRRKTNPELIETLQAARKHKGWEDVAKFLSGSTRKYKSKNLFEINTKENPTINIDYPLLIPMMSVNPVL